MVDNLFRVVNAVGETVGASVRSFEFAIYDCPHVVQVCFDAWTRRALSEGIESRGYRLARGNSSAGLTSSDDAELIARLRQPVDQGGYDGFSPDPLHVHVADRIEYWVAACRSEQELHNAWRKRAEESEKEFNTQTARITALEADAERLDYLEDWFSNGDTIAIQHDTPDWSDHIREYDLKAFGDKGQYPWTLSCLLVKNAYGEDDRRNETLREAIDAAIANTPNADGGK